METQRQTHLVIPVMKMGMTIALLMTAILLFFQLLLFQMMKVCIISDILVSPQTFCIQCSHDFNFAGALPLIRAFHGHHVCFAHHSFLTINAFFILLIIININIEYGNPFNIVCWRETQDLGEICAKYCYVV